MDRLKPRRCCKDSAAGECPYKRKHGAHKCNATGGKGNRRGLSKGPARHKVPPMLVDEILAALFPKTLSLREQLLPLRQQFSDIEIKRALAPVQGNPTGDGEDASDTTMSHSGDMYGIV